MILEFPQKYPHPMILSDMMINNCPITSRKDASKNIFDKCPLDVVFGI